MWDRFLRACRREPVDRTPVWFMRQAGRYMPEYRALRERWGILDIISTPELAAEVTMQPVRAFEPDAAIVFSDILPILTDLGLKLEYARGEGPVIHNPVRRAADVAALASDGSDATQLVASAVKLVAAELDGRTPLIGFAGAPFTLATYSIEGGGSVKHERTKGLMLDDPGAWSGLMSRLAEAAGRHLVAQAEAGAQALQIFDSWAGALSPHDYRTHVAPHTRHTIAMAAGAGVPVIFFSTQTTGFLEDVTALGADVVSVDWRVDIDAAWQRIGPERAIQGNLDPATLMAPWPALVERIDDILHRAGDRPGHIFNLGHGVLPNTDPVTARRVKEHVHRSTERVAA
jgi:uroporphyrinogen decarboxylase